MHCVAHGTSPPHPLRCRSQTRPHQGSCAQARQGRGEAADRLQQVVRQHWNSQQGLTKQVSIIVQNKKLGTCQQNTWLVLALTHALCLLGLSVAVEGISTTHCSLNPEPLKLKLCCSLKLKSKSLLHTCLHSSSLHLSPHCHGQRLRTRQTRHPRPQPEFSAASADAWHWVQMCTSCLRSCTAKQSVPWGQGGNNAPQGGVRGKRGQPQHLGLNSTSSLHILPARTPSTQAS